MISYYELLGLIKDGKQPDKVKYDDNIYIWNEDNYLFDLHKYITDSLGEVDMFDKNIEIIEEKPKKIGKLNIEIENKTTGNAFIRNEYGTKCFLTKHSKIIAEKVNELIEKANYLLEEDKYDN